MGASFDAGMVLVLSIWDDHAVNMLWLDSDYPTDADASAPGVSRGPCAVTSGTPEGKSPKFCRFQTITSNLPCRG